MSDLDEKFLGIMDTWENYINQMRFMVVPKEPIDKGAFLDEYNSATNDTTCSISPGFDRHALVKSIIAYTSGSGTLSIGARSIPLAGGLTVINYIDMVVSPGSVIQVTGSISGPMYLEIMGNILSGTNWSRV